MGHVIEFNYTFLEHNVCKNNVPDTFLRIAFRNSFWVGSGSTFTESLIYTSTYMISFHFYKHLRGRYYFPHFTDEETERDKLTCPRSHS